MKTHNTRAVARCFPFVACNERKSWSLELQPVTADWGFIPEREPCTRLPHLRMAAGAQITNSWRREVVTRN